MINKNIVFLLLLKLIAYATPNSVEIVIIGAGPSGFAATSRLLERGFTNVTVLEAKNRIGGRINTIDFADGVVEMGAQWVQGDQDNIVFQLAAPYDLLHNESEFFLNWTCVGSEGDVLPFNESTPMIDLYFEIGKELENTTAELVPATSYGTYFTTRFREAFNNKPSTSNEKMEQLLIYFDKLESSASCSESWYDLSAKGLAEYSTCEGEQLMPWKKNGYKTLFDILQKKFSNETERIPVMDKIHLEKELESIDYTNPDEILITTSDGTKYNAKHVIFTPSLGVLKHQHSTIFNPALPELKQRAIQGTITAHQKQDVAFGVVLKIFLEFPQKWWPDDLQIYGFLWSNTEREEFIATHGKDKEWYCDIIGFLPVINQPRVLAAWSWGKSARFSETLSDDQITDGIHFLLKKFLGKIHEDIPKAINIVRSKWHGDKHTRGSYSYDSLVTEQSNASRKDLAEPINTKSGKPVILFAGEATNEHRYSTVHGAVESGFREADRLYNYYS